MIENINWLAMGGFVLLAIERVIYYSSRYFGKNKRLGNNPGAFIKLLEKHEKMDEKRHDELKNEVKELRDGLTEHGNRLVRLETPGR